MAGGVGEGRGAWWRWEGVVRLGEVQGGGAEVGTAEREVFGELGEEGKNWGVGGGCVGGRCCGEVVERERAGLLLLSGRKSTKLPPICAQNRTSIVTCEAHSRYHAVDLQGNNALTHAPDVPR